LKVDLNDLAKAGELLPAVRAALSERIEPRGRFGVVALLEESRPVRKALEREQRAQLSGRPLGPSWIGQAKAAASLVGVAAPLGLREVRRGSFGPCPACEAERRSARDKRGPIGSGDGLGWRCHACGAGGDVLDLLSFATVRARLSACSESQRLDVWGRASELGLCDPPAVWKREPRPAPAARPAPLPRLESKPREEAPRMPAAEVRACWDRCAPLTQDPEVSAYLAGRAIDPERLEGLDLACAFPKQTAADWSKWRGKCWGELGLRLVVKLFDPATAEPRALHARATLPGGPTVEGCPKALTPTGRSVSGLVMASPAGRWMLAGETQPRAVLIAEGVPDFLSLCLAAEEMLAGEADDGVLPVLGILSGSLTPELAARVPMGAHVVLGFDPDGDAATGGGGAGYVRKAFEVLRARAGSFGILAAPGAPRDFLRAVLIAARDGTTPPPPPFRASSAAPAAAPILPAEVPAPAAPAAAVKAPAPAVPVVAAAVVVPVAAPALPVPRERPRPAAPPVAAEQPAAQPGLWAASWEDVA
jgi:hypothetical protein